VEFAVNADTNKPARELSRQSLAVVGVFSLLVALLWAFPSFWYNAAALEKRFTWFAEQTAVADWLHTEVPISKSAEAILVADRVVNSEFTRLDRSKVRAYSAKRYLKKQNEIGLFSHTPDRCWTAGGWKLEATEPDFVERAIHGVPILFERRIFSFGAQRELVYFGALVGGKPLPYRIDQYLGAGKKMTRDTGGDQGGTLLRLSQGRLWGWAFESFVKRSPLSGPQQFIRVSTPISDGETQAADERLANFLAQWLVPTDYSAELAGWKPAGK